MSISLEKGQRISLEKNGQQLNKVCIGVNWGAIEKKGLFGGIKKIAVDLDASVSLYSASKDLQDLIYFGQLKSKDGSIVHSGDDTTGDLDGDDGLDNEVITVNLAQVPVNVNFVAIILNSYKGQDFATIPFASVRLYEGTPTRVDQVIASYNIANDAKFSGAVSMVLGSFYRHNGAWKFKAIGEPTQDKKLEQLVKTVASSYL